MSELSVNLKAAADLTAGCGDSISSDQVLMRQVADGGETAMVELVDRYGETLARLIGRLTAWHDDSNDILQDVLLTAWQKAADYQGQGSLEGWLKRIAVNRCRNHFRTLAAMRRKLEAFASLGVRQAENSRVQVGQSTVNPELEDALAELKHADRMILVLYYLEEIPGDEVARMLSIREESMHVRLHRARKRLKPLLSGKLNRG